MTHQDMNASLNCLTNDQNKSISRLTKYLLYLNRCMASIQIILISYSSSITDCEVDQRARFIQWYRYLTRWDEYSLSLCAPCVPALTSQPSILVLVIPKANYVQRYCSWTHQALIFEVPDGIPKWQITLDIQMDSGVKIYSGHVRYQHAIVVYSWLCAILGNIQNLSVLC